MAFLRCILEGTNLNARRAHIRFQRGLVSCRLSCVVTHSMGIRCLRRIETVSSLRALAAPDSPDSLKPTLSPPNKFHPVLSTVSSVSSVSSLVSSSIPSSYADVDDTLMDPTQPFSAAPFSNPSGQLSSAPPFDRDNISPSFKETFGPRAAAEAVRAGSGSIDAASSTVGARTPEIGIMVLGGEEPGVYPSQYVALLTIILPRKYNVSP